LDEDDCTEENCKGWKINGFRLKDNLDDKEEAGDDKFGPVEVAFWHSKYVRIILNYLM
jgi:hypothetical protein